MDTMDLPLWYVSDLSIGPLGLTENSLLTHTFITSFIWRFGEQKVSTTDDYCFPLKFSASVPNPKRALELAANTEKAFYAATKEEKMVIQGSQTDGKQGAWKYWNIPQEVDSIQLIGWSVDTGKKSFKVNCELLQGPNNVKQSVLLQCGGGSQPYHMVLKTPGSGWVVRMQNKKFMEDGLIQFAVLPYTKKDVEAKDLAAWSVNF